MDTEILSIIEKHMPAQTGKMLQERLALVDTLESENDGLRTRNLTLSQRLTESEAKNAEADRKLTEALGREKATATLSCTLSEQARTLDVAEAKYKQTEAERRSQDLFQLVSLAFKSPVYSESIKQRDEYEQKYMNNGTYENVKSGSCTERIIEKE